MGYLYYACAPTETVHRRPDVSAIVGQDRFVLPCRTSPGASGVWWYQVAPRAAIREICNVRGDVINGYRRSGRFSLRRDAEGDFSVVVDNVSLSVAGLYTYVNDDGYGDYFITRLCVSGKLQAVA